MPWIYTMVHISYISIKNANSLPKEGIKSPSWRYLHLYEWVCLGNIFFSPSFLYKIHTIYFSASCLISIITFQCIEIITVWCMDIPYSTLQKHLGCFQPCVFTNNTQWITFSEHYFQCVLLLSVGLSPRSGTAGSKD